MKKKCTIIKSSIKTRIANLIIKDVKNALTIFSNPADVSILESLSCDDCTVIEVKQNHGTRILSFAEIDEVREVVDKFKNKYHGICYYMDVAPYLAQDGETWLHQPTMEISVR